MIMRFPQRHRPEDVGEGRSECLQIYRARVGRGSGAKAILIIKGQVFRTDGMADRPTDTASYRIAGTVVLAQMLEL